MIKIENYEVVGWEHTIRGMRNPMNSWDKSDSGICKGGDNGIGCDNCARLNMGNFDCGHTYDHSFQLGKNDYDLMTKLRNAGTDHRKFMRMITVYVDITAPLYWWKEFDTYKVGTVANSCSTMHKIQAKEFTQEDFSCEHLGVMSIRVLRDTIKVMNDFRDEYLKDHEKVNWWQMIQLLPSSYNQKRTVMLNYEVLANIYKSRCDHKLDEWHTLCEWIEKLPYSEMITDNKTIKTINELRAEQGLPAVTDYEKHVNKFCDIGNINAVSLNDIKMGLDLANGKDFAGNSKEEQNG